MIKALTIRNLALIDEVSVDFAAGFNAFTGETGAGKTIIITGLDLLAGARADSGRVRAGEERLEVEGLFSCDPHGRVARLLEESGLEGGGEAGEVVVRRVISREGRNRCWVNGRMCTASVLAELGEFLVDIHGQHEHQRLLDPRNHLEYLDRFGGDGHLELVARYREAYSVWREARGRVEGARMDEAERLQQVDILRHQTREIEMVDPAEGELEGLEERRRLMQNAEVLYSQAGEARAALCGEGPDGTDALAAAVSALARVEGIDPRLGRLREELEDAAARVDEVARELRGYLEGLQFEPAVLEEAERRIFDLKDLMRKYGPSLEEVRAFAARAAERLRVLEDYEAGLARLEAAAVEKEEEAAALAAELSAARRELAARLSGAAAAELAGLGMEAVRFAVEMGEREVPGESGGDSVEFTISPGRGEPARPVARIASGGELARVMLALKIVLARADEVDVLVFDEADAGIGGLTAGRVGEKMAQLAGCHQIITVTHLPQIAACADAQFRILKGEKGGRPVTRIKRLDARGRREELARMLGGAGESALRHADELLKAAASGGEAGSGPAEGRRGKRPQGAPGTLPGI